MRNIRRRDSLPQALMDILGHQVLKPHYEVRAANSGEKALRIARSTPAPDLILLDVMMPATWSASGASRPRPT